MRKYITLILMLFIILNLSPGFAMEISEELFKQEEELLLLGEDFVITATKHPEKVKKAPSIVTVITAKHIKQMGARYLIDVLRTVPGLEVATDEVGREQVSVRGVRTTESEKVKFMIDGISLNPPFNQTPLDIYYDYPLEHVKRIEVIRGPGSALYGTNAFLAIINVITKDAEDIDGFQITGWGGSFDTQNYNLVLGKKYGDFKALLMLDYYDSNGPRLEVEDDKLSAPGLFDPPGQSNDGKTWNPIDKMSLYWKLDYNNLEIQGWLYEEGSGAVCGSVVCAQ